MTTYFISDIHLAADSSANSELLLEFLRSRGPRADAIYILGDLFGLWLGDDLNLPYANAVATALKALANLGIPIYLMRGNRDFLLGQRFCQSSGAKLLPDPYPVKLYGQQVLLTHGDLLCTFDRGYQKFRALVQNPLLKSLFLGLPLALRRAIANWLKTKANRDSQREYKTRPEIFDVAPSTAQKWIDKYQAGYLIHGHTHKPGIYNLGAATRIVLGDWNEQNALILALRPGGFALEDLRATADNPG